MLTHAHTRLFITLLGHYCSVTAVLTIRDVLTRLHANVWLYCALCCGTTRSDSYRAVGQLQVLDFKHSMVSKPAAI